MQNVLSNLQRDMDFLKDKKAHAMASKQASESRLQEIVAEMQALGVTPDTIEGEIAKLKQQANISVEQLQSMIANIKAGNYQAVILQPTATPQPAVQSIPVQPAPAQPVESVSFTDDLFADL